MWHGKKIEQQNLDYGRNAFKYWQHSSWEWCRAIEKRGIFLQVEKAAEIDNSDLTCHVFSLEDVVAYVAISNPINH